MNHKGRKGLDRSYGLNILPTVPDVAVDVDILFISYDNICGAVGNLCDAINKHTQYKARYATAARNYLNCDMDLDLLSNSHTSTIQSIIKHCNAIHWSDVLLNRRDWFCNLYNLTSSPYIDRKINSFHFHGSVLRQNYPLTKEKHVFVSTPDLLYYAPNGAYLPNLINEDILKVETVNPHPKEIIQCLTVTDAIGGYIKTIKDLGVYPIYPGTDDIKGSTVFARAMKNISKKIDVKWCMIKGLSNSEVIQRKARTSMLFDQMWLGSYGVNAIEALYLNKPVVARLSDYSREWYKAWGDDECPVLQVELDTIEKDLTKHILDDIAGSYCRDWVKKAHNPETVARVFVEKIMEGEK